MCYDLQIQNIKLLKAYHVQEEKLSILDVVYLNNDRLGVMWVHFPPINDNKAVSN